MSYENSYKLIGSLKKMGFEEDLIYNDLLLQGVSEESAEIRIREYNEDHSGNVYGEYILGEIKQKGAK